jgi:hypothetical protein
VTQNMPIRTVWSPHLFRPEQPATSRAQYHASNPCTLPDTYMFRFSDGTANTSYTLVLGAVKHIH